MVIKNSITFRKKHRPVWYGLLCFALVTAAVAAVGLFPSQIDDAETIEGKLNYTLTDGDKNTIEHYNHIDEILNFINDSEEGSVFIIIVNRDVTFTHSYYYGDLKKNIYVTLTSSSDGPFKLTINAYGQRHFEVYGTLTLENIILESVMMEERYWVNGGFIDGYGGGGIKVNVPGTLIMNGGAVIQNCGADESGGGVENLGTFIMNGGEIRGNMALIGGGVFNNGSKYDDSGIFTMNGGKISGNTAFGDGGGGVFNCVEAEFTMNGGEISGNTATNGGGVFNYNTTKYFDFIVSGIEDYCVVNLKGGMISDNTAVYGGGIFNDEFCTLNINGGMIVNNKATGEDPQKGSGGGIYTLDYENVFVKPDKGKSVVFSGNTAPTLRIHEISNDHYSDYQQNIGDVKLDKMFDVIKKAPAYNNFDINYPGDSYVVAIVIIPEGGGDVAVKDKGEYTVYANGYVYVPLSGDEITLSATPKKGNEFIQFIKGELEIVNDSITFEVSGNMKVFAEFLIVSTEPEQPEQKDYFITATADGGSAINPSGTVTVPYGENKTFLFSAKPGYQIKAVYVNGVAISSAELASGAYTFSNVMSNHTISVVSEVEAGSGGDIGGGGSDGTGSGPDVSGSDNLYVIGIICAMLAVIAGAIVFVWRWWLFVLYKRRKKSEEP